VTFALIALIELITRPDAPDSALAALLVVPVCATLVVTRRHPVAAVAVFAAALLAASGAGFEGDFPPVSAAPVMFILAYSCGAHAPLRRGLIAVVGLIAAAQVSVGFSEFPNVEILFTTLAPWWVGWEVGRRRRLVSALDERTRELEAEEDAFVRLSVRRERARIARELHDIVAHHLAVIVVQAGAGRMAGADNDTPASERLASIRQSGDQALAETSRLVDIIHADGGASRNGADRLRALVEDARAAGLKVDVTPPPSEVRLPAQIEDDALRVVQEGLTNAVKHAPGARVSVRLVLTTTLSRSSSATAAAALPPASPKPAPGWVSVACVNASNRSAAASMPVPAPRAAGVLTHGFRPLPARSLPRGSRRRHYPAG
jgi:signal transduction histidine kinase